MLTGNIQATAILLLESGTPIRALCVEAPAIATFGSFTLGAIELASHEAVRVIEAFRVAATVEQGYERYRIARAATEGRPVPRPPSWSGETPVTIAVASGACVAFPPTLLYRVLHALSPGHDGRALPAGAVALDALDAFAALDALRADSADDPVLGKDAFVDLVRDLCCQGLLGRPVGQIDLGDLRRHAPFDLLFGFARGTPIDRYYLERFLEIIRPEVRGAVLEVGGRRTNQQVFGFHAATEYRAMDFQSRDGVDVVGDAHDRAAIPAGTLDTILIFNVLEHCARPWIVAENLHAWLRPGGKVCAMVPSVQRVHRAPRDYWRPFPDGMEALFSGFDRRRLFVYGNPLATIAAAMGIAAEELTTEELDRVNPGYPVATCLVAEK